MSEFEKFWKKLWKTECDCQTACKMSWNAAIEAAAKMCAFHQQSGNLHSRFELDDEIRKLAEK